MTLIFVLFLVTISFCQFPKNFVAGKIIDLDISNFHEVAATTPFLLVEFYAPWCPYCKQFAPELQKADSMLQQQKSQVKVARVDASAEANLAEENGIKSYPTIKYYRYGHSKEYFGSRNADDLVTWLNAEV